ncbi:MAG: hypothetical protein IT537_03270 [Hyphomicrobiales bacterium]|nr:hypothetical protein [Hyphomicrobiales bacterium]
MRQARRWLARNDLFYLLTAVCKRRDINHNWLFARCREVGLTPNGHLDLWAREHRKSTIITFALSLQDILASHGEDPDPRYAGREATIGLFSHTRPIAKDFLKQIKQECENNTELIELFPDVLWTSPRKEAPKWSEDEGLIVRRNTNPREATVEAWGLVDGMPTGKHFLVRVYDDVVTERSVTPDMILKTTTAWELSDNLGTEGGWARITGTTYAKFDTYRTMQDRGVPVRIYPCTSDGSDDFGKSVLMSPKYLAEKRRKQGIYTFGAQMLLNPTADTVQGFKEEWLRYWPATNANALNVYIVVDPASKKKSTSDYTAMWVLGAGGDDNYYVLDAVHDRLNLRERASALFKLHRVWRPRAVGYEEYGMQADIEHMQYVMEKENYRFTITPLGGSVAKPDRIKRLVPVFEQGRMFLPQTGIVRLNYEQHQIDIIHTFVQDEYLAFPVGQHDDMLDCMSRILDTDLGVIKPSPEEKDLPKWLRDELEEEGGSWETL